MLKNDKGITLTALVVTIIVIIILAGTTMLSSDMLITGTKAKNTVTNMLLVSRKAEELYENYTFNGTATSSYAGTPTSEAASYSGVTVLPTDVWYKWDKDTLRSLGFDENMLINGGEFLVNYATGEVVYTKGVKDNDGNIKYTLTALTK